MFVNHLAFLLAQGQLHLEALALDYPEPTVRPVRVILRDMATHQIDHLR